MKYSKANSLRTQQNIALYGKSARHPVCLAALKLWGLDAKLEEVTKDVVLSEERVNSAKQQKKEVRALLDQFYKDGKQKDVIRAADALRRRMP